MFLHFSQIFETTLMFEDWGSGMVETFDAYTKGIDYVVLWKDLKKHPVEYATASFTPTALGTYSGARRGNIWYAAFGAVSGAAAGIFSHYVQRHNFKKSPEPVKTSKLKRNRNIMTFKPREKILA